MRIAVIGTGISGSLVARLLSTQHEVTVFEANHYAGGHANTVDVTLSGKTYPVDTGFMVYNHRTYPNFCRLLEMLCIHSHPSDMSFSVSCSKTGVEYQGSSLNGLFAQRSNLLRPSFLRMLSDITRFNRAGMSAVTEKSIAPGQTVGEILAALHVGDHFIQQYLIPMSAAIWSSTPGSILEFPAEFMLGFFANHGLMQLRDRPQWRTIRNGSRQYVEALLAPLASQVRLNSPVESVIRSRRQVTVKAAGQSCEYFDEVVFASHADQCLSMLADPTPQEREILTAFPYQRNEAVLHTDTNCLPNCERAWASWNYHIQPGKDECASVTYDLSRLQNHRSPVPILLTLNESHRIDRHKILRTFDYYHPAYSLASIAAQRKFEQISGKNRTHFCGAYWGYGFHEDGVNSALAVAQHFDMGLEACTAASTKEPSGIAATSR